MSVPPLLVEECDGIRVVRDDRVPGGTKARVLGRVLERLAAPDEIVYASPAEGYAQIACAIAAADSGRRATIFTAQRQVPSDRTAAAAAAGARIEFVPHGYLSNITAKARAYCAATGALLLPFGLDFGAMREEIGAVAYTILPTPEQVWSVAGSGCLTRALQAAWPEANFHAVRIGHLPDAGRARMWTAPETFARPARRPPPFPSCSNYDAKAWAFVQDHAVPGALFWNVAA